MMLISLTAMEQIRMAELKSKLFAIATPKNRT